MPIVKIERQKSTKHNRTVLNGCEFVLPLDPIWEFPRDQLDLISSLGEGNFGKVMMAQATSLLQKGVTTIVAVKMLKGKENWV